MIVKKLIREHIYTPDFLILWNEKARGVFFNNLLDRVTLSKIPFTVKGLCDKSIIEIKPAFDQNNMTRLFTINQKWLLEGIGVYCQKIIPVKLFSKTFTPVRYLKTDKTNKKRKLHYIPKALKEYVEVRPKTTT